VKPRQLKIGELALLVLTAGMLFQLARMVVWAWGGRRRYLDR